jgi:glycosyltransferase involved in cell wall biosynthesis
MNKFSIVIAVYNAEKVIQVLMESLMKINYKDYEIIIIDGASSDQTLTILKNYQHLIAYKTSEPDKGIYDAWNKGVLKATGDWILFLGADDRILPNALDQYDRFISERNDRETLEYISSKIQMIDLKGTPVRVKGNLWEWPFFLKEMTVAHPGSLHSARLFKKHGLFDSSYRSSGDYELLLRAKGDLKYAFMNAITVEMSEGGISDGWIGIKEHARAAIETGGHSTISVYINATWVLIKHKLKKGLRTIGINVYLKKAQS